MTYTMYARAQRKSIHGLHTFQMLILCSSSGVCNADTVFSYIPSKYY